MLRRPITGALGKASGLPEVEFESSRDTRGTPLLEIIKVYSLFSSYQSRPMKSAVKKECILSVYFNPAFSGSLTERRQAEESKYSRNINICFMPVFIG